MDVCVANAFTKITEAETRRVVLQQARLNEAGKQKSLLLMGYSETAFVADSELADFKLEYFYLCGRSSSSGHATIGTFNTVLRHLGRSKNRSILLRQNPVHIENTCG